MIALIRIHGQAAIKTDIINTLDRLRLRKKFVCVFVDEKDKIVLGMLSKVRDYVAYGEVENKLMDEIIKKRGATDTKGKYRGFCRLHPPIGGFKKSTKLSAESGKGILGNNKDIAKLLQRMI